MLEEVNTYFAENNIAEPLDTRTGQVSARIDTWKRIGIWGDSHAGGVGPRLDADRHHAIHIQEPGQLVQGL